jgi:hypothetical protein
MNRRTRRSVESSNRRSRRAVYRVSRCFANRRMGDVLGELDRDLVGLAPVKTRIRE